MLVIGENLCEVYGNSVKLDNLCWLKSILSLEVTQRNSLLQWAKTLEMFTIKLPVLKYLKFVRYQ